MALPLGKNTFGRRLNKIAVFHISQEILFYIKHIYNISISSIFCQLLDPIPYFLQGIVVRFQKFIPFGCSIFVEKT